MSPIWKPFSSCLCPAAHGIKPEDSNNVIANAGSYVQSIGIKKIFNTDLHRHLKDTNFTNFHELNIFKNSC